MSIKHGLRRVTMGEIRDVPWASGYAYAQWHRHDLLIGHASKIGGNMLNHSKRNLPRCGTPAATMLIAALSVLASAGPGVAIAQGAPGQDAASKQDLAEKATDPTAALMSFQLNDIYTASFHGVDGTANQLLFRAAGTVLP